MLGTWRSQDILKHSLRSRGERMRPPLRGSGAHTCFAALATFEQPTTFIIRNHEESCPCGMSSRLSRRVRGADYRGRRTGDEDPGGCCSSGDSRFSLRQGGQVSGPCVFAGQGSVSDASDWTEGSSGGGAELRSAWTAEGGRPHTGRVGAGMAPNFLG